MNTRLKTFWIAAMAVMLAAFAAGCGSPELTPRETMTIAGGVVGAGAGAVIGSTLPGVGSAVGAGVGGGIGLVGGAAVGDEIQIVQAENDQTNLLLQSQQKDMEEQRRELQDLRNREERDEESQTQSRKTTPY